MVCGQSGSCLGLCTSQQDMQIRGCPLGVDPPYWWSSETTGTDFELTEHYLQRALWADMNRVIAIPLPQIPRGEMDTPVWYRHTHLIWTLGLTLTPCPYRTIWPEMDTLSCYCHPGLIWTPCWVVHIKQSTRS